MILVMILTIKDQITLKFIGEKDQTELRNLQSAYS